MHKIQRKASALLLCQLMLLLIEKYNCDGHLLYCILMKDKRMLDVLIVRHRINPFILTPHNDSHLLIQKFQEAVAHLLDQKSYGAIFFEKKGLTLGRAYITHNQLLGLLRNLKGNLRRVIQLNRHDGFGPEFIIHSQCCILQLKEVLVQLKQQSSIVLHTAITSVSGDYKRLLLVHACERQRATQ